MRTLGQNIRVSAGSSVAVAKQLLDRPSNESKDISRATNPCAFERLDIQNGTVMVRRMIRGIHLLLLVCAFVSSFEVRLLATLRVTGELWYTTFDDAGAGQRRTTRAFTATVDGCRWRIRASQSGTNGPRWSDSVYVYVEQANGADSLFMTRLWDTTKVPPFTGLYMSNIVTVSWGKTPYIDPEQFAGAIWLPYASECELGMITNGRIKNYFSMNDTMVRDDITFPFTLRYLSNSSPPVVQELLVRNEGFLPIPKADGTLEKRPFKPPYSVGYVQYSFTVLDYTNTAQLFVPRHSQIKYFGGKAGAVTNSETRLLSQIDIVANSVLVTNIFLPPPELVPPPAVIYDKRLPTMGGEDFSYLSKGQVYETNSPQIDKIYRDFGSREGQIRQNSKPDP